MVRVIKGVNLNGESFLKLVCYIHDLTKNGSQFIISTHSPILLSYKHGKIIDMNNNMKEIKYEEIVIDRGIFYYDTQNEIKRKSI